MVYSTETKSKAESREVMAQCEKGDCYFGSDCVPHDHEEAANWCLSNDYDTGFVEFTFNLGLCYYRGKCVPHDHEEAYFWFFIAAGNGQEGAAVLRDELAELFLDDQIRTLQESATDWFSDHIVPYLS
jgi:TPR repeat protein